MAMDNNVFVAACTCICTILLTAVVTESHELKDYCTGETFRPQCPGGKSDIIVITSARFGRMKFGRCVEEDPFIASIADNPGVLGCSADVKSILDKQCSGLTECELRINNQNFEGIKPCIAGLTMYLEASYSCIKVSSESRHCAISLTNEPEHLVNGGNKPEPNQPVPTFGCGTESQPWSVEALAGQKIAVRVTDFEQGAVAANAGQTVTECHYVDGWVIDRASRKNVTFCAEQSSNNDHQPAASPLYVSASNQVQVVLRQSRHHKFLIRFEAVGCSDLSPPSEGAWLKRSGDQVTVGCYMSRQSWQLNCVNGVWTGAVGVCNAEGGFSHASGVSVNKAVASNDTTEEDYLASHQVLAVVVVTFAGLALCLITIFCGIYCLRKHGSAGKTYNDKSDTMSYGPIICGKPQLAPAIFRTNDTNSATCSTTAQYFVLDQDGVAKQTCAQ